MILSARMMEDRERCGLFASLSAEYRTRVDPLQALYEGVRAGLITNKPWFAYAASTRVLNLAKNPGLAMEGSGVYGVAKHYAGLAKVILGMLRNPYQDPRPWKSPEVSLAAEGLKWKPSYLIDPEGVARAIFFVDSAFRVPRLLSGWRGRGDAAMTGRLIYAEIFVVGPSIDGMRESPLTRGWQDGQRRIHFDYKTGRKKIFREQVWSNEMRWLDKIRGAGLMDSVHLTREVEVPRNPAPYLEAVREATPAHRRLAGCDFPSRCPFYDVCWEGAQISTLPRKEGNDGN